MTKHVYGFRQYGGGTGVYRPESKSTPQEAAIVNVAIKTLQKTFPDAFILKTHGGGYQRSGLPDIYIALRSLSIWIEMKRPGADTTALQLDKLKKLEAAGALCGTAESPGRAVQVVNDALEYAKNKSGA